MPYQSEPIQDMDVSADDEAELVRSIVAGQTNQFAILVKRYETYVFSIVARYVPQDHVEEVAHEAFIQAFQSLGGFRRESLFRHWLSGVTARTCYQFWRAKKRGRTNSFSELSEAAAQWCNSQLEQESVDRCQSASDRQSASQLAAWALDQLSAEDRMCLVMLHCDGYSVQEVAKQLGWSVANVKVRAFRSRKHLKKLLLALDEAKG